MRKFAFQTWALLLLQIVTWPLQVAYSILVPCVFALLLRKPRVLTVIPYDLLNAVAGLLGCFVLPVVLRFVPPGATHLPRWCWIWDNAWDTIDGDPQGWNALCNAAGVSRMSYLARLNWLAVRNGTANLSRYLLGYQVSSAARITHEGYWVRDGGGDHSGWLYIEAREPSGKVRFCYASLRQWGSSRRAMRTYLGWKLLWQSTGAQVTDPPPGYWAQEVVYWNPWFGFNPPGASVANN